MRNMLITVRSAFLLVLFSLSICVPLKAQTFQGTGGDIPDDGNYAEFEITISGLVPGQVDTTNFGLEQVCINLQHPFIGSVDAWLIAPDGTKVILTSLVGAWNTAFANTCFRQDASLSILSGSAPYTGNFRPIREIGFLNNGQSVNGTWKLRILDIWAGFGDPATLFDWSITFGTNPASYTPFVTSDLPIVVIDTEGQDIPREKIMAVMYIVDNGPGMINHVNGPYNDYQGFIGIRVRGHSSSYAPKKSYGVELWDANGEDIEAPILGMPAEEDWILGANYYDKTQINNTLTFTAAQQMGHYASRHRHVEVVLNGEYIGLYVMMERIKRDSDRVNIARLDTTHLDGDELTGGYIVKLDKSNDPGWNSLFPPMANPNGQTIHFHPHYPRADRLRPEQLAYIKSYVDSFEVALAGPDFMDPQLGYANYIDVLSFIDFFIINELSKDVDGYRISTYMHKQRNSLGGKLRMGPVWDYDIAWGNANYCGGDDVTGWAYQFGDICSHESWQIPFWWYRFLQDPYFNYLLRCRWEELRLTVLSTEALHQYCDDMAAHLDQAQQRNFAAWEILGVPVWPNPTPVPTSYAGEISDLKNWITARSNWMDNNLPGTASACTTGIFGTDQRAVVSPYPNPFHDHVLISWPETTKALVMLYDMQGRMVLKERMDLGIDAVRMDVATTLPNGSYMLQVIPDGGDSRTFRLQR